MNRGFIWGMVAVILLGITLYSAITVFASEDQPIAELQPQQEEEVVFSFVSGTEYRPNQIGQVIVQARNKNGVSLLESIGSIVTFESIEDELFIEPLEQNDGGWTEVSTFMDGGRYAGGSVTFGASALSYVANMCKFNNLSYSSFEGYTCGFAGKAMMRNVSAVDDYILGGKINLSMSHRKTDGGSHGYSYLHMVIADYNESDQWDYRWYRVPSGGFPAIPKEIGPNNGLSLDLVYFEIYQRINGDMKLIYSPYDENTDVTFTFGHVGGNSAIQNPWCTLVASSGGLLECQGRRNSVGPAGEVEFYVDNGFAVVVVEGEEIIRVKTNYRVNENTTYGVASHALNNVYSAVMHIHSAYDITNSSFGFERSISNCEGSILYPSKEFYLQDMYMFQVQNTGNAYFDFKVPNQDGVYEYQAKCNINGNDYIASKSFHVTRPNIRAMVIK